MNEISAVWSNGVGVAIDDLDAVTVGHHVWVTVRDPRKRRAVGHAGVAPVGFSCNQPNGLGEFIVPTPQGQHCFRVWVEFFNVAVETMELVPPSFVEPSFPLQAIG